MSDIVPESAFTALFLDRDPLLDVRAPREFARGAFPCAVNLPLLDDEQRAEVGKRYRQGGRESAIALGTELIAGEIKTSRIAAWADFLRKNPSAKLYCYRGGLRSQTVQNWLRQCGLAIPRIEGGYKAMRRFLIDRLDCYSDAHKLLLIGGKTGCGKTQLVHSLANAVDLEGLARHRGSAFGRRTRPQPAQIDFENSVAIDLLRAFEAGAQRLFLEDESRAIGSLSLPIRLHGAMRQAPMAIIEEPLASRVDTILMDYIDSNFSEFKASWPEDYAGRFESYLLSSLDRIRRRLGQDNYQRVRALMCDALQQDDRSRMLDAHRAWIQTLLTDYYDPMYDYQLGKKDQEIVFRGSRSEFQRWASKIT